MVAAFLSLLRVGPSPHRYLGDYPVAPLVDGSHGGFEVNVTVHLWVPDGGASGTLSVHGDWATATTTTAAAVAHSRDNVAAELMQLEPGEHTVSLQINATADQIKLWWPNGVLGHGPTSARPFYNVTAEWTPTAVSRKPTVPSPADDTAAAAPAATVSTTRRIGFRVFALVTVNDTDAAYVKANATADGSGKHGMFFRVNGAAIYSRGANMIPMEELEGRLDSGAHRILVSGL